MSDHDDDSPDKPHDLAMQPVPRLTRVDGVALVDALTRIVSSQLALAESIAILAGEIQNMERGQHARNVGGVRSRLERFRADIQAATKAIGNVTDSIQ